MKKTRILNVLTSLVLTFVLSFLLLLSLPVHVHAESEKSNLQSSINDSIDCSMEVDYDLNSITLWVYTDNKEIITSITLDETDNEYSFSSELWNLIKNRCSETFFVCISAYQTDTPITGEYYSELISFTIPQEIN